MKKSYLFLTTIFAFILIVNVGCSAENSEDNNIAYISPNTDSEYVNTFKDLGLGVLYDFDFQLPHANKSWVTIWVEGYKNGEKTEPFHLTEFSYGLSPERVEEGHLGFGLLNPVNETPLLLVYAPAGSRGLHKIENNILISEGLSTWDYAIGNEKVELKSGETKILGVYRQAEKSLKTYDLQDPEAIKKMINDDRTVLLLKIKVEEKNKGS